MAPYERISERIMSLIDSTTKHIHTALDDVVLDYVSQPRVAPSFSGLRAAFTLTPEKNARLGFLKEAQAAVQPIVAQLKDGYLTVADALLGKQHEIETMTCTPFWNQWYLHFYSEQGFAVP